MKGKIGPTDALSALDDKFSTAYETATAALMHAVLAFETSTGRVVESIALETIDITSFASEGRQHIRQASLHFLPKPGEVS